MIRTTHWVFSLLLALITYLVLLYLSSYRLVALVLLAFIFGFIISKDEWRVGRAVLKTIVPILGGITLLFLTPLFWATVIETTQRASILNAAAYGFLLMLALTLLLGVPFSCAGVLVRHYKLVRSLN